jgi:demethylmenaquinone methyltransferase / 2-methoxy-6-polyprenyl-1,4-benzoquinol methylase
MFDRIARRYDLLNTVLSGGRDASWRRRTAAATGLGAGGTGLDVACGSGKLTAELRRRAGPGRVIGLDFSAGMLRVAGADHTGPWVRGDGLSLPFADATFDAVTVAFGLRNFVRPVLGLEEMCRVLRPGGRAVVLEFLRPRADVVGSLYRAYLRHVLPGLGGLVSGQPGAYRYLSDTVDGYRTPEELLAMAAEAGWREARLDSLTLGTVGILSGSR